MYFVNVFHFLLFETANNNCSIFAFTETDLTSKAFAFSHKSNNANLFAFAN